MPELESAWGYPAILALMLLVMVVMLAYFRRKKMDLGGPVAGHLSPILDHNPSFFSFFVVHFHDHQGSFRSAAQSSPRCPCRRADGGHLDLRLHKRRIRCGSEAVLLHSQSKVAGDLLDHGGERLDCPPSLPFSGISSARSPTLPPGLDVAASGSLDDHLCALFKLRKSANTGLQHLSGIVLLRPRRVAGREHQKIDLLQPCQISASGL